jgi:hypothetical protein
MRVLVTQKVKPSEYSLAFALTKRAASDDVPADHYFLALPRRLAFILSGRLVEQAERACSSGMVNGEIVKVRSASWGTLMLRGPSCESHARPCNLLTTEPALHV